MKKMIDELWDGEISPQDTLISDNQEYRELQHRQSRNKAELLEALAGLYALFNTTIIPTLTEKISGMFNYAG